MVERHGRKLKNKPENVKSSRIAGASMPISKNETYKIRNSFTLIHTQLISGALYCIHMASLQPNNKHKLHKLFCIFLIKTNVCLFLRWPFFIYKRRHCLCLYFWSLNAFRFVCGCLIHIYLDMYISGIFPGQFVETNDLIECELAEQGTQQQRVIIRFTGISMLVDRNLHHICV